MLELRMGSVNFLELRMGRGNFLLVHETKMAAI
jgi:hypothetical protein